MKPLYYILIGLLCFNCSTDNTPDTQEPDDPIVQEEIYFPPLSGNEWETITPEALNWDSDNLNALYNYLDERNTKGFIILKDGKIVVEKYFNGHHQNAAWPWYSAAKSLTATAIGIAQQEGFIDIDNKTSDYLGNNWSSLTQAQQDLITVKHHLTMTTGLQNTPANFIAWTCTPPICMIYNYDAGTAWQYHQGAFIQLQNMLSQSTGTSFKLYIKEKLLDRIGISGSWSSLLDVNIFSSNTRGLARFGLLALNNGTWNETILVDASYFSEMTITSQNINKSYGYLWWLNGKDSFVGTDTNTYSGSLIPNGPQNMFCALGAQDQKIYVIPDEGLVVVRSGEAAGVEELANSTFDNELWQKINLVIN